MTINLDQARKLCELGVEVKAEKDWRHDYKGNATIVRNYGGTRQPQMGVSYLPAYNAEELIKLLRSKEHIQIDIYSHGDGFMFHQEGSFVAGEDDIYGSTLTEALGNKLIHDLENGIITAGEVNK